MTTLTIVIFTSRQCEIFNGCFGSTQSKLVPGIEESRRISNPEMLLNKMKLKTEKDLPKEAQKKLRRYLVYEILIGVIFIIAVITYLRYM